jgi:hypothetical protein
VIFYELWFDVNFLTFKLRFEIGVLAFSLARPLFWLLFKKIGRFFTNHLVTLLKLAVISPYCKDLRLAKILSVFAAKCFSTIAGKKNILKKSF